MMLKSHLMTGNIQEQEDTNKRQRQVGDFKNRVSKEKHNADKSPPESDYYEQ